MNCHFQVYSTKETVAIKVGQGIPPARIIDGIVFHHCTSDNHISNYCLCIESVVSMVTNKVPECTPQTPQALSIPNVSMEDSYH